MREAERPAVLPVCYCPKNCDIIVAQDQIVPENSSVQQSNGQHVAPGDLLGVTGLGARGFSG